MNTDPAFARIGVIDPRATPLVALLVEDNPPDAELIAIRLEPGPHGAGSTPVRIIQRGTAATACAALRYWAVDVVILDLTLPDARGLEALHRIRAAAPGTPVIVLSGIADQALALEALRAGAQDYVMKPPPEGQTLARILRYAVERQRLTRTVDDALRTAAVAARQWKMLAEVSKALAPSGYSTVAIPEVAGLCVPEIADCFVLFLASDEDDPGSVALWHTNGEKADELKDAIESFLRGPESAPHGWVDSPRFDDETTSALWDEALTAVYAALDFASGTAMPLRFGGRVRGVLVLAFTPGRRDPVADVEFTRSVAYRISMALEQQRMLRQTQRAVAARDRALSIVSHDLRNPLSTIEICALALLDPAPAPQSGIHEMGELIQRSAGWMQQIVEDLLDRASLDAGRLALHRRPTSVAEILDATRLMFAASAAQRTIDLVLDGGADLPSVDVDPHRLLQVLSNLISNAMKFTPSGGRVQLLAQAVEEDLSGVLLNGTGGHAVRFTVSDTGLGISSDELRHIFDWYWQSPKGPSKGAGLGLAIAKGLIEAHSSRLNVESVPGSGSSFWFTVPTANGNGVVHSGNGGGA
ncbi:MAG TPA: hybrid sensor histidine kinase/response regulator [Gemmatimonadaceae bacterium]|jgi:signal transduction histidine kinase/DNA-binding NarL/FixJ family response regulator|nr:hybrid sensor histidine kinase/response regulator [Gemmatimonadaceae bacterium]